MIFTLERNYLVCTLLKNLMVLTRRGGGGLYGLHTAEKLERNLMV